MTLNGVMAVTLRYFTEFGKPALQKTICAKFMLESIVFCSACTMSMYNVVVKKVHVRYLISW